MHVLRRVTKPGFPEYDVREIISPRSETIVYNITLFCDHVSLVVVLLELVKFSKDRKGILGEKPKVLRII